MEVGESMVVVDDDGVAINVLPLNDDETCT